MNGSVRASRRRHLMVPPMATALLVVANGAGAATAGNPTTLPPAPAGYRASEFRMAAPPDPYVVGPVSLPRPTCKHRQITATAATRRTAGGVLGVVRLRGAVVKHWNGYPLRCTLPIAHGPDALLGRHGQPLGVPRARGDRTNPPGNVRPDLPISEGNAVWGFAWFGSYCGTRARAVEIPLDHRAAGELLRAPLRGPQPACDSHTKKSSFIDGVVGWPKEPVQPPRPDYRRLRLTGHIEHGTTRHYLAPIRLTLRAVGANPVSLDPCPLIFGRWYFQRGDSSPMDAGHLPCYKRVLVMRPGAPLHVTVPSTNFGQTAPRGSKITVDIGIAGVPELHFETTAH